MTAPVPPFPLPPVISRWRAASASLRRGTRARGPADPNEVAAVTIRVRPGLMLRRCPIRTRGGYRGPPASSTRRTTVPHRPTWTTSPPSPPKTV